MKVNPVKCHLRIVSTSQSELKIVDEIIKSNTCEKLLGIESDNKLRLNAHVRTYAKIVTPYMTVSKRRVLINDFFKLQFSCCPYWECVIVELLIIKKQTTRKVP